MAKRSWFHVNERGYSEVLKGPDARSFCETRAYELAAQASSSSGIDYRVTSMVGTSRIHTRVSTDGKDDYFRERKHDALRDAVKRGGGRTGRALTRHRNKIKKRKG